MCKSLRAHGPQCMGWRRMCVGGVSVSQATHAANSKSSQLNCWPLDRWSRREKAPGTNTTWMSIDHRPMDRSMGRVLTRSNLISISTRSSSFKF